MRTYLLVPIFFIFLIAAHKSLQTFAQQALDANGWYITPKPVDLEGCIKALHGVAMNNGAKPFSAGIEEVQNQEAVLDAVRRKTAADEVATFKGPNAPPPSQQEVNQRIQQKEDQEKASVMQSQQVAQQGRTKGAPQPGAPSAGGGGPQAYGAPGTGGKPIVVEEEAPEPGIAVKSLERIGGEIQSAVSGLIPKLGGAPKTMTAKGVPPKVPPAKVVAPVITAPNEMEVIQGKETSSMALKLYQTVAFSAFALAGGASDVFGLRFRGYFLVFMSLFIAYTAALVLSVNLLGAGAIVTIVVTILAMAIGGPMALLVPETFGLGRAAPKLAQTVLGWISSVAAFGCFVSNLLYQITMCIVAAAMGANKLTAEYIRLPIIFYVVYPVVLILGTAVFIFVLSTATLHPLLIFSGVISTLSTYAFIAGVVFLLNAWLFGPSKGIPLSPIPFFHPLAAIGMDYRFWVCIAALILLAGCGTFYQYRDEIRRVEEKWEGESGVAESETLSEATATLLDHPSRLSQRLSVPTAETTELLLPYLEPERENETSDEEVEQGGHAKREKRSRTKRQRRAMLYGVENRW